MELGAMEWRRIALALLVGAWSLMAQFIFNRIIFFYVANSEYVAASIITLHLLGFLLGSLAIRRWPVPIPWLIALSMATMALAFFFIWWAGVLWFGLYATVGMAALFSMLSAALAGALVISLMAPVAQTEQGRAIIIADTAGSVLGALVGGFLLIPLWGINASFAGVLAIQTLSLLLIPGPLRWASMACGVTLIALGLFASPMAGKHKDVLTVEGFPIELTQEDGKILFETRSPYGLLSVTEIGGQTIINIDNRPLCSVGERWAGHVDPSAWDTGEIPMKIVGSRENMRVANIGLGCGITLSGILSRLPESGTVDVIELNPEMSKAQELFQPLLKPSTNDPRVTILIDDGFRHFAVRGNGDPYDVIAIDVAWMQNMNATHLFSREMYQNLAKHLKQDGVVSVWSEESNPFSPVSLIIYQTLAEVFPEVIVETKDGLVVFIASPGRNDLVDFVRPEMQSVRDWMSGAAEAYPINSLNDLAMNRFKFTVTGDSTWERLEGKYSAMREALSARTEID
jgi:predicted membrane-bound spermidine synthase